MIKQFLHFGPSKVFKIINVIFLFTFLFFQKIVAQQIAQPLHQLNALLINTVMEDLFTPPIASRIYVYPNIAFYECIRHQDATLPTLVKKLNGLNELPLLPSSKNIDTKIAATVAFTYVAQNLVGTEYKIANWRSSFIDSIFSKTDSIILINSINYGKAVADSIIEYTKKDNYLKSRAYIRNVTTYKPGDWQPTPLDYAQGIEPHWNTIRPLTLKSAAQFSPKNKLVFSYSKKSLFYKNMLEVYNIAKKLDTVKKATALYWDDNPNVSKNIGHLNYFIHKISPAGHWVMIAQQALIKANTTISKASQIYTLQTIAMFDAFISCWDEKYRTNLIRPITIINRIKDASWEPYLQTPPFPEFTSGHSVVSNAATVILTAFLGNNFSFTDATEIPFGMPPRNFNSFYEASEQSSMSRVYGGIHYPETARISVLQGRAIGKYVINALYPSAFIK